MRRRSTLAGTIFCPANPATLEPLVTKSGLQLEPAERSHHYRLTSQGRLSQPELLQDFLEIVERHLDDAVADQSIEAWWPIAHGGAQFKRMEMRNPNGKRFDL